MKRLIVVLLSVCMVVSMFAGLSATAYADYDTSDMVEYTMKEGDTVYNICNTMGISFWDYENVIKTVNKITSYSSISVGAKLYFPKPGSPTTISSSSGTATGSSSSSGASTISAGSVTSGTDSFSLKAGDKIAYYLIPHTMQAGEKIMDVCSSLGINYYSYSSQIARINGLASCDNVAAGTTILLPSLSAPNGACYRVIAHTVAAGDTTYNKCNEYGINYYSNLTILKGVNNTNNLASIVVGGTLYLPIAGTASGSGTGTGTGTGSGTGTGTGTGTATGTMYNITIATAAHGSVAVQVNSASVTKAAEGASVVLVPTPDKGYALDSFTVTATSGGSAVIITDEGFTMPAFAVTVTPTFREASAYQAKVNAASHGSITLKPLGGSEGKSQVITEGTKVTVVPTPDKGYVLDSIKVTNTKGDKKVEVNDNTFIMPDYAVVVTATFMASTTHNVFVKGGVAYGEFWFEVDGKKTNEVNVGKTVTVVCEPIAGFQTKLIKWFKFEDYSESSAKTITDTAANKYVNTFVMPDYDVTVSVEFETAQQNNINLGTFTNGKVEATNGEGTITKAKTGDTVTLKITPDDGYALESLSVKDAANQDVVVSDGCFQMPNSDVTITATFAKGSYSVTVNLNGTGTAEVKVNSVKAKDLKSIKANKDDVISVVFTPGNGCTLDKLTFTNPVNNKKYTPSYDSATNTYSVTMPNNDMAIDATFIPKSQVAYKITKSLNGTGAALTIKKDGAELDPCEAVKGDTVTLDFYLDDGKYVSKLSVVNGSGNECALVTKLDDSTYTFLMPGEACEVKATVSDVVKYNIAASMSGSGSYQVFSEGYPVSAAVPGTKVNVSYAPADGYVFDNIVIHKAGDASITCKFADGAFTMPAYDVEIVVTFKPASAVDKTTYAITSNKNSVTHGEFHIRPNDVKASEAKCGDTVYIYTEPHEGYNVTITVTYNNGLSKLTVATLKAGEKYSFEMPNQDVYIEVVYSK